MSRRPDIDTLLALTESAEEAYDEARRIAERYTAEKVVRAAEGQAIDPPHWQMVGALYRRWQNLQRQYDEQEAEIRESDEMNLEPAEVRHVG